MVLSPWAGVPGAEGAEVAFGGGDGSAGDPFIIEDVWDLQDMNDNLTANYTLGADIDASNTITWNSGAGFVPIGTNITPFVGSLDGRNHTISGLYIHRPDTKYVGLIGYLGRGHSVKDVGLDDVEIIGGSCTGALIGYSGRFTKVSGSHSSGNVTGTGYCVGGLLGYIDDGTVDLCHSTATVVGTNTSRWYGLIGGLIGSAGETILSMSYTTGDVTGASDYVGGLIGSANGADLDRCYSTGDVVGATNWTGGLIGREEHTDIVYSYATGNVTGDRWVGGFLGGTWAGRISRCYATGNVSGGTAVGGFMGWEASSGIADCYFAGNVTGNSSVGGFTGDLDPRGELENCHYNVDAVLINGGHHLTIGGLYDAQYRDWLSNNLSLDISDYNTTLVPFFDKYDVFNIQGLRDLLGFAYVENLRFRLANDIDLTTAPGLYIPYINAEFNGEGKVISNLRLDMPFASCLGMFGANLRSSIENVGVVDCHIVGADHVGGVVGMIYRGMITRCYATGNVSGGLEVGGVVGIGSADNCFASANVTGDSFVGGYAGYLTGGHPSSGYSTGSVTGNETVGGFAGRNGWLFSNCYSSAKVSGKKYVGGLVGGWGASTPDSFWDIETSGQNESNGGTGKTTVQMQTQSTYTDAGWDFNSTWCMIDHESYPLFRWQEKEAPVADAGPDQTVDEGSLVTFDGSGSHDDNVISLRWRFEDEYHVALRGTRPNHTFENPGKYEVTLTVIDAVGTIDTDTMTVTVNDTTPPVASAGFDQTVRVGALVTFDGRDSWDNGGDINLTWTFDDDGAVTLYDLRPTYRFFRPGTFQVTLTVTDGAGILATDVVNITVVDLEAPQIVTKSDIHTNLGETATLDARLSFDNVGVTGYNWTWEYDGTWYSSEEAMTSFTYHMPGTFDVVLTITDAAGNLNTTTVQVHVIDLEHPMMDPDWDLSQVTIETLDIFVELDSSVWSDNDASFPEGANFSYTITQGERDLVAYGEHVRFDLPSEGLWYVTMTATDASGNEAMHTFDLQVDWLPTGVTPPMVDAGEDLVVTLGEQFQLTGLYVPGELTVEEVMWTLLGGTEPPWPGAELALTANKIGQFEYAFTVRDWMGNEATDTVVVSMVPRAPAVEIVTDLNVTVKKNMAVEGMAYGDTDIKLVEYRIDGGQWVPTYGAHTWSFNISINDLADGEHILEVRVDDGYSTVTTEPVTFVVDKPPEPVDSPPGPGPFGWDTWLTVGVVMVACIVFLAILFVVFHYRRTKE
jgi:PKD repeat protein